ncbi:hypothetical protein B0T18DRAFT_403997 [Schizothecium vesticola]|uniref:AAA+ ATPase domain-containing protein n=1 Tax=Schizothecium vesticola TaxID=314040 RepID=A0AA40F6T5_9PEZI|nr:hypothetical protein B0T18DRAFT_403997 [Schizothecium vesticola]
MREGAHQRLISLGDWVLASEERVAPVTIVHPPESGNAEPDEVSLGDGEETFGVEQAEEGRGQGDDDTDEQEETPAQSDSGLDQPDPAEHRAPSTDTVSLNSIEYTLSESLGGTEDPNDGDHQDGAHTLGDLEVDPKETWKYHPHITISRDVTKASGFEKEQLAVLQSEPGPVPFKPPVTIFSHPGVELPYFQDHRMKLMLLEQQNKKIARLSLEMDARDAADDLYQIGSSGRQNLSVPSGSAVMADAAIAAVSISEQNFNRIAQLEEDIQRLRGMQHALGSTSWHILHKIEDEQTAYLVEPSWTVGHRQELRLRGNTPIADEAGYLRQRLDIAFVVYKYYRYSHQEKAIQKARDGGDMLPDPEPAFETVQLLSDKMVSAVDEFLNEQPTFKDDFPGWDSKTAIRSPFLFWYHYRSSDRFQQMAESHRSQMQLLSKWIDQNYGQMYSDVDAQFSRGYVSASTMPFFVRPGEVLVSRTRKGIHGYIAESWTSKQDAPSRSLSRIFDDPADKKQASETWGVSAWSYQYDGRFHRVKSTLHIELRFEDDDNGSEVDIATLNVLPLRFAGDEFRAKLDRRGRLMWACRHRNLIAYDETGGEGLAGQGSRYMVDFSTYKKLHPANFRGTSSRPGSVDRKEMDAALMDNDTPPQGPELLVLPDSVTGYNLRQKKWQDLRLDLAQNVTWNKQAFKHLVIDEEIKDLVQALVTSKVEVEQGTDLIQGKGNGLIILLHGGPGTGKTFTAESVAEIAEKPLFRVTCGDIGTRPEAVEKYLESVLHLGKIWDCVVLLDEADVFLEQRTLTDLDRNALVSVFLRVLEYYEGILILTSNRVGTFDEAFKSRIQLSLHYESLNKSQRRTIWENFLDRLGTLEEENSGKKASLDTRKRKLESGDIDFDDIHRHLAELAAHEMNGREIRNAITTGRQLAKFKHESMSYKHLKHVIGVSRKFNKYLESGDYTDDQNAWGRGIK